MPDDFFSKELIFTYFCTKQKEKKYISWENPLKGLIYYWETLLK